MTKPKIPLNNPQLAGSELDNLRHAVAAGSLAGDGHFTDLCHSWLEANTGSNKALLTHSCTAALEMAALLLDIAPGDEVIMPSHTFVSTANAFVLRGGIPVFVDIRPDTLNIDENLIEAAITPRTRAIVAVHYAGIACEMDTVLAIAARHGLAVVEDAAQGLGSTYQGRALGSIGDFGTFSFHETKNVVSGEGGALLVNRECDVERAEIIREKGTDRSRFFRGEVDKYTWQDAEAITAARRARWYTYHAALAEMAAAGRLTCPTVPDGCALNGHIYYVLLPSGTDRGSVLARLRDRGIGSAFHYVPLHSSPGGLRYGRVSGSMAVTDDTTARLIRLPMSTVITSQEQARVVAALGDVLG